jgi:HPt (histidine-containing phosphotransfer) domain-containing protein/HAMP domain-containing protein
MFVSLKVRLLCLIFAVTATVVLALGIYFPRRHMETATRSLEAKTTAYGRLAGQQLASAVAFDDRETAREVMAALALDADVRGIALYRDDGSVIETRGDVEGDDLTTPPKAEAAVLRHAEGRVASLVPVVSKEGPRGLVMVELSTSELEAERGRIRSVAAIASAVALALGFVAAWLIGRSMAVRIARVSSEAQAVARGELGRPALPPGGNDEVGALTTAFNGMVGNIRGLMRHIEETAEKETERLEGQVRQRTAELGRRNDDMTRLLAHVDQGFLTVGRDGLLGSERSKIVDTWFGAPAPAMPFVSYLETIDPHYAMWFAMGWDSLLEDVLPRELSLEQLPSALTVGERHFRLAFTPIDEDGAFAHLLIIVSDVTSAVAQARADAQQAELRSSFERALRDRTGFREFIREAGDIVSRLGETTDGIETKRALHTLKGNCGLFGFNAIARFCHDLESTLEERPGLLLPAETKDLEARWKRAVAPIEQIFGESSASAGLDVEHEDVQGLVSAVQTGSPREDLVRLLWGLEREPVRRNVERAGRQAVAVAERLGKPTPTLELSTESLRHDAPKWGAFWMAISHVVRNAMDHGIEPEEERIAAGKPAAGKLRVAARREGAHYVVEIADDGRGIDWARVAERAAAKGLPTKTRSDLEEALFHDGLSTRETANDVSGRGAGMGAVRAACAGLGGIVQITSTLGAGTTMRFVFPASALGREAAVSKVTRARDSFMPSA